MPQVYVFIVLVLLLVLVKQVTDRYLTLRYADGRKHQPQFHKHQLLLYVRAASVETKILVFHVHDVKWFDEDGGYRYAGFAYEKSETDKESYTIDNLQLYTTILGVPEGRLMVPAPEEVGFLKHSVYSSKP
jgi:hypothetical protein